MTRSELMKIAKYGIEKKIEYKCADVVRTCARFDSIESLKNLIAQYDEIVQEYDAARKEETTE